MKTKLTLALVATLTSTAFAEFKAPLPEFKNEKQLAEWRVEKASQLKTRVTTEESAFYTGRPYLASTGGYAFKYRDYNPELARWTSEDPSGFPDGANASIYTPVPTTQIDCYGLSRTEVSRSVVPTDTNWQNAGKGYNGLGNIYYNYQYRIDYAGSWSETSHGQTTASGEALDFPINVGLSDSETYSVGAKGFGVTLGGSVTQGGSVSQTLTFNQPASEGVAWEGYALAIQADVYTRREMWTYSFFNSSWANNGWSTETKVASGVAGVYGKVVYKNVE